MLLIRNDCTDPYFNLASEQYFIENFTESVIMLWRNEKAIVIGRNQNAAEEINCKYVQEDGIKVVRRLTGGGAVFHDLGNINYTVIQPHDPLRFCDYAFFTEPVCGFLRTLGVSAVLSGRNDLLIDGSKFSGNAQTSYKGRLTYHGTLMFDANIADMTHALNPNPLKIQSKGIKSVRSRVTNIASHLPRPMTVEAFLEALYEYLKNSRDDIAEYVITERDRLNIQRLADEKYQTWEWNYGSSPDYSLRRQQIFEFGIVDVRLAVENGQIADIGIFGDFFGMREISELKTMLTGLRHDREDISRALSKIRIGEYIVGMSDEQFCGLVL